MAWLIVFIVITYIGLVISVAKWIGRVAKRYPPKGPQHLTDRQYRD